MSAPPPRKKLGPPEYVPSPRVCKGSWWLIGRTAHVVCTKCKNQQAIATGCTAECMTHDKAIKCGMALGWQMMPRPLCLFCATPLSSSEMFEYGRMLLAADEYPDGAIVEEISAFEAHMKAKYGSQATTHMKNIMSQKVYNPNTFKPTYREKI